MSLCHHTYFDTKGKCAACLEAENERLRAALQALAKHFGPLEDNHMIHPEARRCFRLARAALERNGEKP